MHAIFYFYGPTQDQASEYSAVDSHFHLRGTWIGLMYWKPKQEDIQDGSSLFCMGELESQILCVSVSLW